MANDIVPGKSSDRPIAILGAKVFPVSSPPIRPGTVVIRDGKIAAIGPESSVAIPENAEQISGSDLSVYPGLIDAFTGLGLVEIQAVRATVDMSETGAINPNAEAIVAFNPDSELIPVARSDGILLALSVPTGQFVNGLSSLMQLDGWNAYDMALRPNVGLHVRWPPAVYVAAWNSDHSLRTQVKSRNERLRELEQLVEDARLYARARASDVDVADNLRLEAMRQVVNREIPLIVHTDELQEIQESVAFAVRYGLRLIITGGYDAPRCADLLKRHSVPVIVASTQRLPMRRNSPYDEPFTIPAQLQKANVRFCISGRDSFSAASIRNLPQQAGIAAAHGLTADQALRSITLSAAEILGVVDQVGSLEVGKHATLIVTTGDILEIPTQVRFAFIQGRPVDLDNRQKRLYRKYLEKYRRLEQSAGVPSPS